MQWIKDLVSNHFCSAEQKQAQSVLGMPALPRIPVMQNLQKKAPVMQPSPGQQQPLNNMKPSVAAQVGQAQGGQHAIMANIQNMFTPKSAATHSVGELLPKDWNKTLVEPTKKNGGIGSYGREAWNSTNHYRKVDKDDGNFDKAFHTQNAKMAELGKLAGRIGR